MKTYFNYVNKENGKNPVDTFSSKELNRILRGCKRYFSRTVKTLESIKNQKTVDKITINIEWKKSRTYGYNPTATARVDFTDGTRGNLFASCSGWGYDKASTVIADIFNQALRYTLLLPDSTKTAPYGIRLFNPIDFMQYGSTVSFEGGIGADCYFAISEFIGGKFEKIAGGKTFETYTYQTK
jgi:hypothetical protein